MLLLHRFNWLAVIRLVFGVTVAIWELNMFWMLNRSNETFIVTLVLWWLWFDARLTDSCTSWESWLRVVSPTLQWPSMWSVWSGCE